MLKQPNKPTQSPLSGPNIHFHFHFPHSLSLSLSWLFHFQTPASHRSHIQGEVFHTMAAAAAALARFSRKSLTSSTNLKLLQRTLATQAASPSSTSSPKSVITPSADRVSWDYRGQRRIIPLGQWLPKIAVDAYVAPNVVLAGQVTVCDGASVWAGSVLRGDLNKITVGFCSSVQERCVIHAAWSSPTGL